MLSCVRISVKSYITRTCVRISTQDLFEERALLLGKLGRHGVALAIYAHVLQDPQMAEEYCRKIYDPTIEENKEVSAQGPVSPLVGF